MKVLGFVNRFSRGVQRVQEELKANGNGDADFNLKLETVFLVTVNISKNSFVSKNEAKDGTKNGTKNGTIGGTMDGTMDGIEVSSGAYSIYLAIVGDNSITRENIASQTGLSTTSVSRAVTELKQKRIIARIGGKRYGFWKILKNISVDESRKKRRDF